MFIEPQNMQIETSMDDYYYWSHPSRPSEHMQLWHGFFSDLERGGSDIRLIRST